MIKLNYEEFAERELNKLIDIQEKFLEEFNLNSYKHWFYESEFSILRLFNNEQDEIFFNYIPIGTFSNNTMTWMWSWFNKSSIEPNKNETLKVKDFGLENKYEKLFEGTFTANEYDASQLLSISFYILNGIGIYKVTSDHLDIYMILTSVIENKNSAEIKKMKQNNIKCEYHGFARYAFVCQHLNFEHKTGFEEAFETFPNMNLNDDEDLQAWCNDCEKIRISTNGWNEESERYANIRLICEYCYFELKEFNLK